MLRVFFHDKRYSSEVAQVLKILSGRSLIPYLITTLNLIRVEFGSVVVDP